jgi:putative SOS response-associated peptidase YedK
VCGRYTGFTADEEHEIMTLIKDVENRTNGASMTLSVKQSGEIFPNDVVPVLFGEDKSLTARAMKWGYPGYADRNRPNAKPKPLINAKAETVTTLLTWKDSVALRRCIIPSSGFYEWQRTTPGAVGVSKDKTKYLFRLRDEDALYMAAIYKPFTLAGNGEISHFSILTTAANPSMIEVHDRMPVILLRGEFDEWLWGDWKRLLDRSNIELEKVVA